MDTYSNAHPITSPEHPMNKSGPFSKPIETGPNLAPIVIGLFAIEYAVRYRRAMNLGYTPLEARRHARYEIFATLRAFLFLIAVVAGIAVWTAWVG